MFALHHSGCDATGGDLLKQLLKQIRFLKSSMPVLGKRRVMRNLLIEAQSGEPTPRHMHAQLFHQLPLAGDTVEIGDQQDEEQQFWVDGGSTGFAIGSLQLRSHEIEVDVTIDQAQQMILRNLIFEAEVVKQRLRAEMVSHHEQQASERGDEQQHPELWPAYSVNSPALQESTQGLFQQTQAFAPACAVCWQNPGR